MTRTRLQVVFVFLSNYTDMSYPCLGHLFAIRGTDGEVLWKTFTKSAVIFINCEDFDVNKDGQKDCIVTGRRATLQAVNPKNGMLE